MRRGPVCDRHRHTNLGEVRIGRESLAAVQDPAAVLAYGHAASAGGIRPGFGLRERPAPDPFAGGELRKVPLFLFLIPGRVDVVRAEGSVRGDDQSDAGINARKLFDDDGVLDVAEAGAPKLLGEDRAKIAQTAAFL